MFSKEEKGFTLVEVIVALAVVAIVSTSLFRLFVSAGYVNREAELTDLAHTIAVGQVERFKKDPESYPPGIGYFDRQGIQRSAPESGEIPSGALIKTESMVTKPLNTAGNSTGYFPDFVGTVDLSAYADWEIEITSAGEIYCGKYGEALARLGAQDGTKIKNNILPLKVEFDGGEPRAIFLINNSGWEAAVYFFRKNTDQSITLKPIAGQSSITAVDPTNSTIAKYNLNLAVSKVLGDVSYFMFTFSADEYVYH